MTVSHCRICQGTDLGRFLSLGSTPLANRFLTEAQLDEPEPEYPLDVLFCRACGLVQLGEVVPPEVLFRHYLYASSTSDTIPAHFARLAEEVHARFLLDAQSLVVEVASNDGCLLRAVKALGVRVLGVEPATNLARVAGEAGIETVNEFFSEATAKSLLADYGPARVIIANNVLAHVDDLGDFVRGLFTLLEDDGTVVIEAPYLMDLLDKTEFDTIYHEHLSYFAVAPLVRLFDRFGMRLFDLRQVGVHGGSLRLYVKKTLASPQASPEVGRLLSQEKARRLDQFETYAGFAARVERVRERLTTLIARFKAEGCRLAAYGAPAKGNTLLNYCKIGREHLEYTVDKSPLKQGLYTPGRHLQVYPPERLLMDRPDYTVLLAWNFAEEILQQQQAYTAQGGRFIIPIPEPRVV